MKLRTDVSRLGRKPARSRIEFVRERAVRAALAELAEHRRRQGDAAVGSGAGEPPFDARDEIDGG
jgi:hypothetical protein